MKKLLLVLLSLSILVLTGCQNLHGACTEELKICADGSSVGRSGLFCEFDPCPPTIQLGDTFKIIINSESSSSGGDRAKDWDLTFVQGFFTEGTFYTLHNREGIETNCRYDLSTQMWVDIDNLQECTAAHGMPLTIQELQSLIDSGDLKSSCLRHGRESSCFTLEEIQSQDPNLMACTAEAKICSDGTGVGRTGPNCEFAPCPGEA